jgi:hypothetical protein
MGRDHPSFSAELKQLYAGAGDPAFADVIQAVRPSSDADLAELIEADGRIRLRQELAVDLARYLCAVPDLQARVASLDAAIDMALRAIARASRGDETAVSILVERHPDLEAPIREAAALGEAVWSTTSIGRRIAHLPLKSVPCDFGPSIEGGRRRYELRELLGEGAFGQVYLAIDRQLSEEDHSALVSIKVFPRHDRSAWERHRIAEEAMNARRIDHPNVVRVIDRGVSDDDEDFVVYEYVAGGDLIKRVRRGGDRVTVEQAVRIAAGAARGVHAAHMAGLVHCDLKPNNIVLAADGTPKVADFGIAIRAGDARARDDGGEPAGTLAFMSPEQYRMEEGALTIPTDVYALGSILYWLLTGELPNGANAEAIRRTHDPVSGRREPPHLDPAPPGADGDLEAICRRAMAIRPQDRYDSAAALADDLDAWRRREPIPWTRPGPGRRLALWARRKPALAAASAAIVVLAASSAVALWALSRQAAQRALVEARREAASATLTSIIERLGEARDIEHAILPQLWIMEWLLDTEFLANDAQFNELWDLRIDVVQRAAAETGADGHAGDLEPMLWTTALGFWFIRDAQFDRAEEVLEDNARRWRERLRDDDRWLLYVDGLLACAKAGKLQANGGLSGDTARTLMATIDRAVAVFPADEANSPMHALLTESRARLARAGPETE